MYRGREDDASLACCQQALLSAGSRLPAEWTADAISSFRDIVKNFGGCTPEVIIRDLRGKDEYSDIRRFFMSTQDIISFARCFPGYFEVIGQRIQLVYKFSEERIKYFLMRQGSPFGSSAVPPPYVLITNVRDCQRQVGILLARAQKSSPIAGLVLAVDCEGVKLGKEGPLTLLQIGTADGQVLLFDILATPNRRDMFTHGGLQLLLEDPNIVKVIHDCRSDQCALYFQFGVVLTNVFDTSIAFMTIRDQCNNMSGPHRPTLTMLLEIYGLDSVHKSAFARRVSDGVFGERPLTKEMIDYAVEDVRCLVPMIYENMDRLISPLWRPHFNRRVKRVLAESRVTDPRDTYNK